MRPGGYDSTLSDVVSKEKTKGLGEMSPDWYRDMPDRVWETHAVAVGVCNSLNALQFEFRRDEHLPEFFHRTQAVISALLDETGRYEEYDKWLDEHKNKKGAKNSE